MRTTKLIRVTIEKIIEVSIPNELLTKEEMLDFSKYMFPVATVDHLFTYAAESCFSESCSFVEGLGKVVWAGAECYSAKDDELTYQITDEHIDIDVLN